MQHPVATIINFCTNEARYLTPCIEQCRQFSKQVVISVCDHFFDGTAENRGLLESIYAAFPDCLFLEYPYIPKKIPKAMFRQVDPAHFWHSLSRLVGASFLKEEIETILFLDADEIPEAERMKEWLLSSGYLQYTVLKLANYWYFRQPEYQADRWEDSPVLLQRAALSPEILLKTEERQAIYDALLGPKKRMVQGMDGLPLVHHYSWVRTESEMLKKVQSWGHHKDRDWEKLVREEFSRPFSGVDFVHGYRFREVPCPFSLSLEESAFPPRGQKNVYRLSAEELMKLLKSLHHHRSFQQWVSFLFGKGGRW